MTATSTVILVAGTIGEVRNLAECHAHTSASSRGLTVTRVVLILQSEKTGETTVTVTPLGGD